MEFTRSEDGAIPREGAKGDAPAASSKPARPIASGSLHSALDTQSFREDLAARGFNARAPPRGRSRPASRSLTNDRAACPSHSDRLKTKQNKIPVWVRELASGTSDLSETVPSRLHN